MPWIDLQKVADSVNFKEKQVKNSQQISLVYTLNIVGQSSFPLRLVLLGPNHRF